MLLNSLEPNELSIAYDRRHDPRREVDYGCRVYLNTGKRRTKARPLNVSRGGALVSSPIPPEQGHQVALVVESGSLALRNVSATVRHMTSENEENYLLGLQFDFPLEPGDTDW